MKEKLIYFAPQFEVSEMFAEGILCDSYDGQNENYDFGQDYTWDS